MRRSPPRGTAIRGAPSAPARRARHRALPQRRRPAPRFRARVLLRMPSRLSARVFVQGAVFLPELPPEARARLWGLGRGKRSCARTSPAIRLHRAANAAADLLAQARTARGAVPYRGTIADPSLYRRRVEGRPGLILFVQTFGDLLTFNPHIHVLAADGVFRADGAFVVMPAIP